MSYDVSELKKRRAIGLALFLVALSILICFNVLKPSQEEKDYNFLKEAMLKRNGSDITPEQRDEMRNLFDRLSPESKDKLMKEILRGRLEQIRRETEKLSEEEKYEKVDKAIRDFRRRFSNLSEDEKARIKNRLDSAEGREQFKKTLEFYSTEFTAKERELLDPLVHEIIGAISKL